MNPGDPVKNLAVFPFSGLVRIGRIGPRARAALLGAIAAACVAIALAGFVTVRHTLPGAVLRLPPGYALSFDGVSYDGATMHLDGVRIADEKKTLAFEAVRLDLSGVGFGALFGRPARLDAVVTAPHLTLFRDRATSADLRAAVDDVEQWEPLRAGFAVRLADASLTIEPSPDAAAQIVVDRIAGSASVASGRLAYDLDLVVEDAGTPFPVHGATSIDEEGVVTHRWTAGSVPLRPLASLAPATPLDVQSGTLGDLDLSYVARAGDAPSNPRLHVTAHLQGGTMSVGTPPHVIRGLHGALTVVDDGIAAPRILGTIDGVPLEIAGETHDLHGMPFRWLAEGTDDLRAFVGLLATVSSQEHVQDLRLETVAPGVALAQYATRLPYGPIVVTVATLNPREPTLSLDTVLASDHLTSGGERTSAMGARTGAVLGINGDYYDIGRSWVPQGVVIRSGVLLHTPAERMALTVHRDHRVTFGEYGFHGTARVGGRTVALTQLNDWPVGKATFMTPEYGRIPAAPGVNLAELDPVPSHPHRFRVTRVGPVTAPVEPTYGLALGPLVHERPPIPGDTIEIDYDSDPPAADAAAAIGGGPLLLKDGAWFEDPHAPAPDEREAHWAVVAVGRLPDDSLMIVQVDGRHPERSIGITRPDFAELIRKYGVADAMALDSGGSVTLVARAPGDRTVSVLNHPSDNDGERWVANGLFAYSAAPAATLLAPPVATAVPSADNSR